MSSGEAKIWFQSDQEKVYYLVMENHQDNFPLLLVDQGVTSSIRSQEDCSSLFVVRRGQWLSFI